MSGRQFDRRTLLRAGGAVLAGGLAGCSGGDGSDGSDGTDGGADETEIALRDTSFQPRRASVSAGETVTWANEDSFTHDVTATQFHDTAAEWSFQQSLGGGESATYTFEESGVYEYYCTIHGEGSMCGAVLVGGATLDASLPCGDSEGSGGSSGGTY